MPMVYLRRATSIVDRYPALAGVDLEVDRGEVVVIQGANGAGKTSLLRLVAGLLPLSSGECRVLGEDLGASGGTLRPASRKRIGFLGHSALLYEDLNVVENLRFQVRAAGLRGWESGMCHASEEALDRVGLPSRMWHVPAGRLSAGQRRRAALAALVARKPELWLLDEPHAGLDSRGRALLGDIVQDAAGLGAVVLMASHEPEEAFLLADRVVTLSGGRVTAVRESVSERSGGDSTHVA